MGVRRKGTRFYCVVEDAPDPLTGKRRQRWVSGFDSYEEAAAFMPAAEAGARLRRDEATTGGFLERWLEVRRHDLRETTWHTYRRYLENHALPVLRHIPLRFLEAADLDSLYQGMLEGKGLSAGTVGQMHAILTKALNDAVFKGLLEVNPAARATPPRYEPDEPEVWGPSQLRQFLDTAKGDEEWYAYFVLCITAGLRRGEALGVQWKDIDFDAALLFVRRSVTWDGGQAIVNRPKTKHGRRPVRLDPWTLEALRRHPNRGPWVFGGTDPLNPHRANRAFTRLTKQAALPPIRLHDLRHSNATLGLLAGVDAKVMQKRLGHHSASFTMDRYQHVMVGMQDMAVAAIAGLLFQSESPGP